MTCLPQLHVARRPARLRLSDFTPAVLRVQNGGSMQGQLQVVSLTGGLLSLPQPLHGGSRVKLLFLTPRGPVLGAAEMLNPVTHSQQPFRFVTLGGEDQRRLQATIQSSVYTKIEEEAEWIDKYRAAISQINPTPRRLSRVLVEVTLGLLSLAGALLILHAQLFK